eukprot:g37350.t1
MGVCLDVLGVEEAWTRVSQREWFLQNVDKEGDGVHVSGHGILLEVTEMAHYDSSDANTAGVNMRPCCLHALVSIQDSSPRLAWAHTAPTLDSAATRYWNSALARSAPRTGDSLCSPHRDSVRARSAPYSRTRPTLALLPTPGHGPRLVCSLDKGEKIES